MTNRGGILVYGAGAIGCYLGARFAAAGHDVTLLGRPRLQESVESHGLQLTQADGQTITTHPAVIQTIDNLRTPPSLTLVTVKAYSIASALADLQHLASSGSLLVTLQNGIGTEEMVLKTVPSSSLVAASITTSIASPETGHVVEKTGKGGVTMASPKPGDHLSKVIERFQSTGIRTERVADYKSMKWSKLLLNMMANAFPAILQRDPLEIYADPNLYAVEIAALRETLSVMNQLDVKPVALPGFPVPLLHRAIQLPQLLSRPILARRVASGRGEKRPSLRIELDRGAAVTEIDWLNGAVMRYGYKVGVATPVNHRLTDLFRRRLAREKLPSPFNSSTSRTIRYGFGV